jgi:hypothetical protein
MEHLPRLPKRRGKVLSERQPDDAAGAVTADTVSRLAEGVGQFPLL